MPCMHLLVLKNSSLFDNLWLLKFMYTFDRSLQNISSVLWYCLKIRLKICDGTATTISDPCTAPYWRLKLTEVLKWNHFVLNVWICLYVATYVELGDYSDCLVTYWLCGMYVTVSYVLGCSYESVSCAPSHRKLSQLWGNTLPPTIKIRYVLITIVINQGYVRLTSCECMGAI